MSAMCLIAGAVKCEEERCPMGFTPGKCSFRLAHRGTEIAAPAASDPFCFSCVPKHPECTGCERCP